MHADVEARVPRLHFRHFEEPRAGDHDRAGSADPQLEQLGEGGVGAMVHADVVLVDDHLSFRRHVWTEPLHRSL